MLQSINFPLCQSALEEHGGWESLNRDLTRLSVDGIEGIWCGEDIPADIPSGLLTGYHLTFFPDWLDFYLRDKAALERKFGSLQTAYDFYGGTGPESILTLYRADLERARKLNAPYVVFHVSDVSIEEGYTYRWLHNDREVIDAAAEFINELLRGMEPEFDFLMENQWWPGFTFTNPAMTERLLTAINYPRKGIMLDTGHLMNTNLSISNQAEGAGFILSVLERHGELRHAIRGVHLHQSVSGNYVRRHAGKLPADLPTNYTMRFGMNYKHIQQIDRHRPWTNTAIAAVVEKINPCYLTHELSAQGRKAQLRATARQINTLRKGGVAW